MTRNQEAKFAAQAAIDAGIANARDWGRDYYKMFPDLMLVEVAREGAERFDDKHHAIAFLQGYCEARHDHDAFKRGE